MKYCAVLLALLLLMLACPVHAGTQITNCSAAATDNEGGELRADSAPAGALVTIDNAPKGTTPYLENIGLKGVPYGSHTLTLTKDGYQTATIRFQLCSGFRTDVRADLVPKTPAPTKTITPVPTTADLGWGRSSPGDVADDEPVIAAAATLPAESGSLAITTTPAGAEVYVDGSLRGLSPVTIDRLAPGTHAVHLKLSGYADNTAQVAITAGRTLPYAVTLGPSAGRSAGATPGQYAPGFGIVPAIGAAGAALLIFRRCR